MDFNVSRLTSLLTRHSTSAPSGRVSYALVIFLSFAPAAQCRSSVCYAGYRPVKPFLVENFRPRPETPGHAERASLTHERSRCERQVPPETARRGESESTAENFSTKLTEVLAVLRGRVSWPKIRRSWLLARNTLAVV